jgi:3-hydroxyisobutyrate dehydrogenase
MGASMAANLARAGFEVVGWNRTPGKPNAARAQEAGVTLAASAVEAVTGAAAVFLCLTDVDDIEQMLLGPEGVVDAIGPGALVIDMSTTGPQCAQRLHRNLAERGLRFIDAPVSGGDVGAREGTLTIMVGGEKSDFEDALRYFQSIGKNIKYCGSAGAGQAVKLCNQILCAVNMVAVCEAFTLADELGIKPELVIEVCSTGAAGSWALANLGPRIARGDWAPGFKIKDMQKDLRLVLSCLKDNSRERLPGTVLADRQLDVVRDVSGDDSGAQGTQAMMRAYRAARGMPRAYT